VKRIVVAITGASGAILGHRLLIMLQLQEDVEVHLVLSDAGRFTLQQECEVSVKELKDLADVVHEPSQIGASIASGSFIHDGMLIVPCSVKTLSAVANSYSTDLISRAADVSLKEGRPLLLAVRETPFHIGHLQLMERVSQMGGIIFPPIPGYYTSASTLEDVIDQMLGRMLARIGIANENYETWTGPKGKVE
jgi:4-hydroxy-3-polyprenylbenzoate decarboxylase